MQPLQYIGRNTIMTALQRPFWILSIVLSPYSERDQFQLKKTAHDSQACNSNK